VVGRVDLVRPSPRASPETAHRSMTLCDAGPLIAIIDAAESDHQASLSALDQLVLPLVTTWPAFTEAMYRHGFDVVP
jgi:hypothetical protein